MSRMVVSKLDVDVLVQLAMLGPAEATDWRQLTEDPDGLGQALWSANYDAAAYPENGTVPSYTFEPLPITVSAIEGVKQCGFYRYQVGDEDIEGWESGAGVVLLELEQELTSRLPGWEDAPWGWSGGDLSTRMDRREPLADAAAREDERVTTWRATWAAAGLELTVYPLTEAMINRFSDPRDLLAQGFWTPRGFMGSPVEVDLCATVESAQGLFLDRLREVQQQRDADIHLYRFGTTVACTTVWPQQQAALLPTIDDLTARVGVPDQHWWSQAPPLRELDAEILAKGVRLVPRLAGESYERAIYARTPTELETLVSMLRDDDVREQVAAVDTRQQTVLMLRGVVDIHAVTSVRLEQEVGSSFGSRTLGHAMYLETEGATLSIATVVVTDRLTETPHRVRLLDPLVKRSMDAEAPRT